MTNEHPYLCIGPRAMPLPRSTEQINLHISHLLRRKKLNIQVARFQSLHVHMCVGSSFTFRRPGQVLHAGILGIQAPQTVCHDNSRDEKCFRSGMVCQAFLIEPSLIDWAVWHACTPKWVSSTMTNLYFVLHHQRDTCDKIMQAPTDLLSLFLPLLVQHSKLHNVSLCSLQRVST